MNEVLSKLWNCLSCASEIMSSFAVILPVNGTSAYCPVAAMTLDSHLTSPCSMWFIWVCWLNRVFFSLSLFLCLIASLKCYWKMLRVLAWVCLTQLFALCFTLKFIIDFNSELQIVFYIEAPLWSKLCWVCIVRRYQRHSCVLETVQNITQEGTSNFWCGVTGPPTEHYWRAWTSLWKHIVSVVSDNKLMTVYPPSGKSYWACSHSHTVRDLLRLSSFYRLSGLPMKSKAFVKFLFSFFSVFCNPFFFFPFLCQRRLPCLSHVQRWHINVSHKCQREFFVKFWLIHTGI